MAVAVAVVVIKVMVVVVFEFLFVNNTLIRFYFSGFLIINFLNALIRRFNLRGFI